MTIRSKIVAVYKLPVISCGILNNLDRTTGNRKLVTFLITIMLAILLLPQFSAAQTSFPPVTINLSYPQYQRLKLDGGHQYIEDVGMQGIILYRADENTYIAFERLCSSQGEPVSVDGSGLFMKGCDSTFSFSDGYPTGGPATRPLLKYRTNLTGQTLVITDELVY